MGLFVLVAVVHTSRDELGKREYVVKLTKKKENIRLTGTNLGHLEKNTCTQKASYTHIFLLKTSPTVDIGPGEVSAVLSL